MRCSSLTLIFFCTILFCKASAETKKNDEGGSWLGTSFNPFTYEHNVPILDMGPFIFDEGSDFKEQSGVQSIYDRHTTIYQTFKEVSTVQDYYESSEIDVEASGGFDIFSGSASFKETNSFNHSDLTQHRMFIGTVKQTTRFLVVDYVTKNVTCAWNIRFEQFFNVVSKISEMCAPFKVTDDFAKLMPEYVVKCIPLRLSVSLMNAMLKDAGWFVTGVKLGGSIVVRVTLDAEQVSTLTVKQITDGVSAKFGPFFSSSFSETNTQETLNTISSSVKYVDKFLLGGEGSFKDTQSDFATWSKTIFEKPAVIGVKENILCDLLTYDRFPQYNVELVTFAQKLCLTQMKTLVDWNTPTGCAEPKNTLFDPNVVKNGRCMLDNRFTFGGFVQTSRPSFSNDPNAKCQPTVFASPETERNRTLCAQGWYPLPISKGSFLVPSVYEQYRCVPFFNFWRDCSWQDVSYNCSLNIYVCVKNHTGSEKSNDDIGNAYNKWSGGFYTLQQNNPLTGGQSCPQGFKEVPLLNKEAFSCEAFPGEANEKDAVPFGGIYSGNDVNFYTGKQSCPHGHSRYFMGLFYGVPWYFCMVFTSPFETRKYYNLPTLPVSSMIVTIGDQTINLGSSRKWIIPDLDKNHTSSFSFKENLAIVLCCVGVAVVTIVILFQASLFQVNKRVRKLENGGDAIWESQSSVVVDETIPLVQNFRNEK